MAFHPSSFLYERPFAALFLGAIVLLFSSIGAARQCVTDDLDRQVCLEKPARRLISLSPGATELVFAAGGGKWLAAVDDHSDYPSAVASVPRIGGFPNVSVESVVALKPDAVIAWSGGNSPKVTGQLESLGIAVFNIDPLTFPAVADAIKRLGQLFGSQTVANAAAARLLERYQAVSDSNRSKPAVTVFYEIWNKPLMSISSEHIIGQVIELCGGRNIYADVGVRVPRVSTEVLLAQNPQVIISTDRLKDGRTLQERWSKWSGISAVKNGHLFTVPGDLISRPTPRALDAAEVVCSQLDSVRTALHDKRLNPAAH